MSLFFLLAVASARDVVPAVTDVDLTAYVGRWYQVAADSLVMATFENGAECVTADYVLDTDPTYGTVVRLVNSEVSNGELSNVTGFAYVEDDTAPAELTVEFDSPPVSGSYWIIKLGPLTDQYAYAVVSDKASRTLFVLARNVTEYNELYEVEVEDFLEASGFTGFYQPLDTNQDNCTYAPVHEAKPLSYCPSSDARIHAGCDETVTFDAGCDDVMAEITARVRGQFDTWSDPHNNGTYTIVDEQDSSIALTRLTGDGQYTDKLNFVFNDDNGSCVVNACSESQVMSIVDFGTNHCNLFALFCGSADGCPFVLHDLSYSEAFNKCSDSTTACVATVA